MTTLRTTPTTPDNVAQTGRDAARSGGHRPSPLRIAPSNAPAAMAAVSARSTCGPSPALSGSGGAARRRTSRPRDRPPPRGARGRRAPDPGRGAPRRGRPGRPRRSPAPPRAASTGGPARMAASRDRRQALVHAGRPWPRPTGPPSGRHGTATIRSTPSSVSFCTTRSGLSHLVRAKATVSSGVGRRHGHHLADDLQHRLAREPAVPPRPATVRGGQGVPGAQAADPGQVVQRSAVEDGGGHVADAGRGGRSRRAAPGSRPRRHLKAVRSLAKKPRRPRRRPRPAARPAGGRAPPAPR